MTHTSLASIMAPERLTAELHDDAPFERADLESAVWAALSQTLTAYATLLQARSAKAHSAAIADAERALARHIERELVTTLLHEVSGVVDRRAVFEEMKADLTEQAWVVTSPGREALSALWQRVDATLEPLWQQLAEAEPSMARATSTLLARHFANDTSADREWSFVRSAGPRLHLQSRTSPHRVWLEREGRRTFEPVAPFDATVFGPLEVALSRPELRLRLERTWAARMMMNGWLELEWESEDSFVLCAYPGTVGSFRRHVLLTPGVTSATDQLGPRPLCPQDLTLWGPGALRLWEHWLLLPGLLWGGSQRGRAEAVCVRGCCAGKLCQQLACRVVLCSGPTCPQPSCSMRLPRDGSICWEAEQHERFKLAVSSILRQALLQYYYATLAKLNGLHLPEGIAANPERPLLMLVEAELAPLVATPDDSLACRRAYADAVVSLVQEDRELRQRAHALLREDTGLQDLLHSLSHGDTRRFWHVVDSLLKEEWVGHGFQVEERRKAAWRSWEDSMGRLS